MKVRDRMSTDPATITPDTTVADAFQMMRTRSVRRLPVMDRGKLVGIVTLKELSEVSPSPATTLSVFEINYLLAKTRIKDILPKNMQVITIEADENLEKAALLMREHKIGGIPVTEGGKLAGIITETDIFDAFIDILGVNRQGARIDMLVEDRIGVVAEITRIIAELNINIENIVSCKKGDDRTYELIVRIDTQDPSLLAEKLKEAGVNVVAVLIKQ